MTMIKDLSLDDLLKLANVLHDIGQLAFYTKEDEAIVYPSEGDLNSPPSSNTLSAEERRFFVFAIQEERAVKILHEYTLGRRETPYRWTLEIDKPRFRELESEVKQLYIGDSKETTLKISNPEPEENYKAEIETWLAGKSERAIRRIWQVVSALNYQWELGDQDSFPVPRDQFTRVKITNVGDLKTILTNLHNKNFIYVSRKTGEIPPSDDPVNKPGGTSIWEPITDNAEMIHDTKTQIEIFPERFGYLVSKLKNLITERSKSPTTPQRQDIQEQNRPLEAEIDLTDTFLRRAYEKKWDVLQAIWDVYESHSRSNSILVPVARLTIKDREPELIDGIIEGLKKEGLFQNWNRQDRWYDLEFINHEKLPEVYKDIGKIYKQFATTYKERDQSSEVTDVQTEASGGLPYCVIEKGWGYLKFGKHGAKKKISRADSRPFKFLQATIDPLGVYKSVDAVFSAIWMEKDNQDSRLTNPSTASTRKVEIIKNSAIKELQKGNKLDGKIKFEFNRAETLIKAVLAE